MQRGEDAVVEGAVVLGVDVHVREDEAGEVAVCRAPRLQEADVYERGAVEARRRAALGIEAPGHKGQVSRHEFPYGLCATEQNS